MKKRINAFVASCAGLGYSPYAPGTIGSIGGMISAVCLGQYASFFVLFAVGASLTVLGLWSTQACLLHAHDDPSWIVIDEWCAMWFLTICMPPKALNIFLAFCLFRLLDIAKPWPVSLGECVPGAFGVFLDDCIAALLAGIFLSCLAIPGIL